MKFRRKVLIVIRRRFTAAEMKFMRYQRNTLEWIITRMKTCENN